MQQRDIVLRRLSLALQYRTQFQQFRAGQEADSAQLIEADGEDEADFLEEGEDEEVK